ncbi:UDP pyrophosphate phosphatase [Salmonella enterica subsp. arizonae]|uniref:UDP pyrophosphate phosphatase n=1 Tax=Salmonella enterica subsp. arizonae TaxID=59203 RepID=A0A3S4G4P4_SALER|nr:UDP pyrophosphate phosphatase [Salmonella enterica subsp. arizonae]
MLSLHGDELAVPFDFIALSLDVMLENLNDSLFYVINATPDSAQWMISLAIFIAKDAINIVPLLVLCSGCGPARSGLRSAPTDR